MAKARFGDVAKLHRHDIVWLDRRPCGLVTADIADPALRSLVGDWIAAGRPFVVRQQPAHDGPHRNALALGLPLPPFAGKRRIALCLPRSAIDRVSSPPALDEVIAQVSGRWRPALSLLQRQAQAIGLDLRVFGSAAWQALTGLPYLDDDSDVDLLWRPANQSQLTRGLELLECWQRTTGLRADGEIVIGEDNAVAWREWLLRSGQDRVLVKTLHGPVLRTPSQLLQMLDQERVDGARHEVAA